MVVALTAGAADQLGGHSRLVASGSPGVIGYVAKSGNGEPESVTNSPRGKTAFPEIIS
jgi:hypothetical protein